MRSNYIYSDDNFCSYLVDLNTLERKASASSYRKDVAWKPSYGTLDYPLFMLRDGVLYLKEFNKCITFRVDDRDVYLCGERIWEANWGINDLYWELCYLYNMGGVYFMQFDLLGNEVPDKFVIQAYSRGTLVYWRKLAGDTTAQKWLPMCSVKQAFMDCLLP